MRTARLILGSKAALEALKGADDERISPTVCPTNQKGALVAQDKYDREIDKALCNEIVGKCFFGFSGIVGTCKSISRKSKERAEMKKRYGEWICRLVSTLIPHCKSPFLKLCRITAFKNAELES